MTALSKHNLVTRIFMIWWCEHMKVSDYVQTSGQVRSWLLVHTTQ